MSGQREKQLRRYDVTVNGRAYCITNDGSNRYRWRIAFPGAAEDFAATLREAFVVVAADVSERPTPALREGTRAEEGAAP